MNCHKIISQEGKGTFCLLETLRSPLGALDCPRLLVSPQFRLLWWKAQLVLMPPTACGRSEEEPTALEQCCPHLDSTPGAQLGIPLNSSCSLTFHLVLKLCSGGILPPFITLDTLRVCLQLLSLAPFLLVLLCRVSAARISFS